MTKPQHVDTVTYNSSSAYIYQDGNEFYIEYGFSQGGPSNTGPFKSLSEAKRVAMKELKEVNMTDSMDDITTGKSRTMEEVSMAIRSGEETPKEEAQEPGGPGHVEPDGDEVQPTEEPLMPAPKPKTPEEIAANPNEAVNEDVLGKMGAEEKFAMDDDKAKSIWEGVTGGSEHKITACMQGMKGKVDDPGAFCGWLAEKVGYKPV